MSCGSCGGSYTAGSPNVAGVSPAATQPTATKWLVTYPNGAEQEFGQEWAAHQAQAMSGGVLTVVEPPAQTGDPDTA